MQTGSYHMLYRQEMKIKGNQTEEDTLKYGHRNKMRHYWTTWTLIIGSPDEREIHGCSSKKATKHFQELLRTFLLI